jgi:hypothetical protein
MYACITMSHGRKPRSLVRPPQISAQVSAYAMSPKPLRVAKVAKAPKSRLAALIAAVRVIILYMCNDLFILFKFAM